MITRTAASGWRRAPRGGRMVALAVLALVAILVLRFLVADDGYPALLSLRQDLGTLEGEVQRLDQENRDLRLAIHALRQDADAVEKIAREELDFAAPGEWTYLFPGELPPPERRQEPPAAGLP